MIQISSGILRGIPLASPAGKQTRPSSERLRQGTFNILRHYRWPSNDSITEQSSIVNDAVVIDLFAGTGAWGIEAMSNGAAEVWFVESHPLALRSLHENISTAVRSFESQSLAVPRIHVIKRDVALSYRKLPEARLIFSDPPYDLGWFDKVLRLESQHHHLQEKGVLLYEAAVKEQIPESVPTLGLFDTKIYGDSAVHFFVKHRLT